MPRIKNEIKAKALEQAKAGKPVTEIAKELDLKQSTIERWIEEEKNPKVTSAKPVTAAPSVPGEPAATPTHTPVGPPLADLLNQHHGNPAPTGTPYVPPEEPKPALPPLDTKALMALMQVGKSFLIQNTALAWGLKIEESELDRISSFTPKEIEHLEVLAPYAADYTPALATYGKPVMALLFVGAVGMSTARSISELKKLRPVKPKPNPIPPSPDNPIPKRKR